MVAGNNSIRGRAAGSSIRGSGIVSADVSPYRRIIGRAKHAAAGAVSYASLVLVLNDNANRRSCSCIIRETVSLKR